jgi:hypothetical protein
MMVASTAKIFYTMKIVKDMKKNFFKFNRLTSCSSCSSWSIGVFVEE